MIVRDLIRRHDGAWLAAQPGPAPQLVLYFASRAGLKDGRAYRQLRGMFPDAHLLGCSTGGQIWRDDIEDEMSVGVAVTFERTELKFHSAEIDGGSGSRAAGREIGQALKRPGLAGLFVLSEGLDVNGSELVAGVVDAIGAGVPVCGGLAGDGAEFAETLVGADEAPRAGRVAAIGFYGNHVRVGSGSAGGWSGFGPRRLITRSRENVLYELDGHRALDLYTRYLGPEDAAALPSSALLYPMRIRDPQTPSEEIVRTVLGVDFEDGSMRFAGNMPEGWTAELMRGSRDRLVAGAATAARQARLDQEPSRPALALLISCIGRRLMMGQAAVEEIEAAVSALGPNYRTIGFYSYGEISPHAATGAPVLHNQTMTLMTLDEAI